MLDYAHLKNWRFDEVVHALTARDTILYALGIGLGDAPTDPAALRFTYEAGLQAFPTLPCVLSGPDDWWLDPHAGLDTTRAVHGEEDLLLHRPLPAVGTVRSRQRIGRISDKGPSKGAVLEVWRELYDEGGPLATVRQVVFCRGDGGFSAANGQHDDTPPPHPLAPQRAPDAVVELTTRPEAALLYRLSGDWNPLHADPAVARRAGFERPILHGLCTFGLAARAAVRTLAGHDATRLERLAVRFTSPVFPGEAVQFQFWRGTEPGWHLRARVPARGATVLDRGWVTLRRSAAAQTNTGPEGPVQAKAGAW